MTIMTMRCFFVGILNDNEDDIDCSSIVAVDELLSLDRISDIYQDDDRQLSWRMILAIVVPVLRQIETYSVVARSKRFYLEPSARDKISNGRTGGHL